MTPNVTRRSLTTVCVISSCGRLLLLFYEKIIYGFYADFVAAIIQAKEQRSSSWSAQDLVNNHTYNYTRSSSSNSNDSLSSKREKSEREHN